MDESEVRLCVYDTAALFHGGSGIAVVGCYFAGAAGWAGAGAGAVVCAGACLMLDELIGVFTAKEVQMLSTQMNIASPQVAFSMKSVVLRY